MGGCKRLGYVRHERRDKPGPRVLAADSFPEDSFAGILRELDLVPLSFRFVQQAAILGDVTAAKFHLEN